MLPTIEVLIPMFFVPMLLIFGFVIWTLTAKGNQEQETTISQSPHYLDQGEQKEKQKSSIAA